jgi:hypothetical protein
MEAQLRLLTAPEAPRPPVHDEPVDQAPPLEAGADSWRLSTSTRERGLRGVEHARAALHRARSAA